MEVKRLKVEENWCGVENNGLGADVMGLGLKGKGFGLEGTGSRLPEGEEVRMAVNIESLRLKGRNPLGVGSGRKWVRSGRKAVGI